MFENKKIFRYRAPSNDAEKKAIMKNASEIDIRIRSHIFQAKIHFGM